MQQLPLGVTSLSDRLARLGWVTDLLVAGSLATGDYVPGVSDLDLVAVVDRALNDLDVDLLISTHQQDTRRHVGAASDLDPRWASRRLLSTSPSWSAELSRCSPLFALCGWIIDILGARTVGLAVAATTLVLLWIGILAFALAGAVSDASQFWLRWMRGRDFTVLYARGWSF